MPRLINRLIGLASMRLLLAALVLSTVIGVTTAEKAHAYWYDADSYTTPIAFRCYPVTRWVMTASHRYRENRYAIDIDTPVGTPVYATKSGTVVWAGGKPVVAASSSASTTVTACRRS